MLVMIYNRKVGIYRIDVEPELGAVTSDDFTVVAKLGNNTNQIELAHDYVYNLPISSIFISSLVSGIQQATDPSPTSGVSKVSICHRPPGNPNNAHTITVDESAVKAHMGHGDKLGECAKEKEKEHGDNDNKTDDNKKNDGKGEVKEASTGKDKKNKHKWND